MNKIILGLFLFVAVSFSANAQFRMSKGSQKLATVMAIVENLYVDKVDEDKLAEDAVKALLEKLDPHSTYISQEEVAEANEPLEGEFDGIGIAFNMLTDTVYVIETIAGGPAEKVGLRPGDKIIYANDSLIAGLKLPTKKVMSYLKGKKGTKVEVKVLRRGADELLPFTIVRDKIPIHSIDAAYMADETIAYIRVSRFGATTVKEFTDACARLKKEGMKDLILDLEGNGGGFLSAAIDLSDEFLDKDKLIVYTEGSRQPKAEAKSTTKGNFEEGRLVILIDEYSASASEIVSGAVQDWDRGVIVGRRSFGKGLVQRQFPLPDESLIRLTVARYYTPTGRCIQKPYTNGDRESYRRDVYERYNRGEMNSADSIHFPDSLKYQTLINKRTVYGGGGVMPDYYVTVDTTEFTMYARHLVARGLDYKVALNEVDTDRDTFKEKYPTSQDFYKKYDVSDDIMQKLIAEGDKAKVEFNEEEYNLAKKLLAKRIKSLLARDLYDVETQLRIINDFSDIYKKGYEIIKDPELYDKLLKGVKQ